MIRMFIDMFKIPFNITCLKHFNFKQRIGKLTIEPKNNKNKFLKYTQFNPFSTTCT